MEVLKSGEELEKQVLDDARAKASRILAEADRECAALRDEWQRKTDEDLRKIETDRDARIEAVRQELQASLPLDFMRARLSHIQESIARALSEYFGGLSPADLVRVVGRMLRRIPPVFRDQQTVVYAAGIPPQDAKRAVEENVAGIRIESVKSMEQDGDAADVGVVLETSDRRIRFRGTLKELSAQLLEQHREELAAALLGRDA